MSGLSFTLYCCCCCLVLEEEEEEEEKEEEYNKCLFYRFYNLVFVFGCCILHVILHKISFDSFVIIVRNFTEENTK